jgi:glutaredoxin-related protein
MFLHAMTVTTVRKLKQLLVDENGKAYSQTNILADPIIIKLMIVAGLKTVPQIWCENEYIGGYNELREHLGFRRTNNKGAEIVVCILRIP